MPVKFSGSAGAISSCSPVLAERRRCRSRSSASGRANCSPTNPLTNRPPRISPRASMRRYTCNRSRHAGASVSRDSTSRNTTPQRSRSCPAKNSISVAASLAIEQRPAPSGMTRPRTPPPAFSAAALGIDQRAHILETISGDEPRGDQFPQTILDFARQASGGAHQLVEEGRSARFERREHIARRMREQRQLIRSGRQQPLGVVSQEQRQRRDARGPHATASFGFERRMRREPSPHDFSGQAQAVEQLRIVVRDATRQHTRFPGRGRNLVALQLAQDLKQSVGSMQLRSRREMLPAAEKPHEIGGGHRLDLFAQAAQRHAMNAGQDAAVAELVVFGR